MSGYQKLQFLGNYNADLHLKAPLCWAVNALEGKRGTEEQLFSAAPKLKVADNFTSRTHQSPPRSPICFSPH